LHHGGDLKIAFATSRFQNDPSPVGMASFRARSADEFFEFRFFGVG
jgi:hypothetical protein